MTTVGLRRFAIPVAPIAVATTLVAVWMVGRAPSLDPAMFGFSFQDIGSEIGASRDEIIADHLGIIGASPNGNRADLSPGLSRGSIDGLIAVPGAPISSRRHRARSKGRISLASRRSWPMPSRVRMVALSAEHRSCGA